MICWNRNLKKHWMLALLAAANFMIYEALFLDAEAIDALYSLVVKNQPDNESRPPMK